MFGSVPGGGPRTRPPHMFGSVPGGCPPPPSPVITSAALKWYKVLNVDKTATEAEIKKAFRKLSLQHHPDKGGNPDCFKEISLAYEVLSNAESRKKYDKYGDPGSNAQASAFLYVNCPNLPRVAGKYEHVLGPLHNGYPKWKKSGSEQYWLLTGTSVRKWLICGNFGEIALVESSHHDGLMPEDISSWQLSSPFMGQNFVDCTIQVTCQSTDVSNILYVTCPNFVKVSGKYELLAGQRPNGQPLWKMIGGDFWIYSGLGSKKWYISDRVAHDQNFLCDLGYVCSSMSHECSNIKPGEATVWQRGLGNCFVDDCSITVTVRNPDAEKEDLEELEKALVEVKAELQKERDLTEASKKERDTLQWRLDKEQAGAESADLELLSSQQKRVELEKEMVFLQISLESERAKSGQEVLEKSRLQREMQDLQRSIEEERAQSEKALQEHKALHEERMKDIENLQSSLAKERAKCEQEGFEKSRLQRETDNLQKSVEEERVELLKELQEHKASHHEFQKEMGTLQSSLEKERAKSEQEVLEKNRLQGELDDLQQSVNEERAKSQKALQEHKASCNEFEKEMETLQSSLIKEQAKSKQEVLEKNRLQREMDELQKSVGEERLEFQKTLQEHIASYNEFEKEMQTLQSSLEKEQAKSKQEVLEKNRLEREMDELQKSIEEEQAESQKTFQEHKALHKERKKEMEALQSSLEKERTKSEQEVLEKNRLQRELDDLQKTAKDERAESQNASQEHKAVRERASNLQGSFGEAQNMQNYVFPEGVQQLHSEVGNASFKPSMNIYDTDNGRYFMRNIHIECPGMTEEDIEFEDMGNSFNVTLSKRKLIDESVARPYLPIRQQHGKLTKTFHFEDGPFELKKEKCSLHNGILKIMLKKRAGLKFRLSRNLCNTTGSMSHEASPVARQGMVTTRMGWHGFSDCNLMHRMSETSSSLMTRFCCTKRCKHKICV